MSFESVGYSRTTNISAVQSCPSSWVYSLPCLSVVSHLSACVIHLFRDMWGAMHPKTFNFLLSFQQALLGCFSSCWQHPQRKESLPPPTSQTSALPTKLAKGETYAVPAGLGEGAGVSAVPTCRRGCGSEQSIFAFWSKVCNSIRV